MKQEIIYECELCHHTYDNKEECEECEKCHHIPKEVKSCHYHPMMVHAINYPDRITVEFDDGEIFTYTR